MLESAVVVLRLMQYLGAMVLMGSSLFFVFARPFAGPSAAPRPRWLRAGALLAISALMLLAAQASVLAGSVSQGLKSESLLAVVQFMDLGKAAIVRAVAGAAAAGLALALRPDRKAAVIVATLGGVATISLAWMGHGAATDGTIGNVHLASDILHGLAAAVWIGALVGFCGLLLARPHSPEQLSSLHAALRGFSGAGTAAVAILLLTGLVNSWVLVGPDHLSSLWSTLYGRLLSVKILLFLVMLGMAAANRYRLTPALAAARGGEEQASAVSALRRSIAIETALGVAVLALVAWFGTLAPPAAG